MTRGPHDLIRPADLEHEGLGDTPQAWENSARVPVGPGTFERWNFEASFEDGSSAAVVFFTRPLLERSGSGSPGVSLTINRPDGKKLNEVNLVEPSAFSASKERCYVRAGASWVRGEGECYELHVKAGRLSAHLRFTGILPAWRPGSGKYLFDKAGERYLGWLAPIPHGTVVGQIIYDGKMQSVWGTCYHDHRWGSTGLNEMLSHWYWGRANAGSSVLLFAEMTAASKYAGQKIPIFYLNQDGTVRVQDGAPLRLEELDFEPHHGGRSYPTGMDLHWESGEERVSLALRDPILTDDFSLVDFLPTFQRLIGGIVSNPYSFRFNASLDLSIALDGWRERQQSRAVVELMLFR